MPYSFVLSFLLGAAVGSYFLKDENKYMGIINRISFFMIFGYILMGVWSLEPYDHDGRRNFTSQIIEILITKNHGWILLGVIAPCLINLLGQQKFRHEKQKHNLKHYLDKLSMKKATKESSSAYLAAGIYQSSDIDYQTETAVKLAVSAIENMDRVTISNIERSLLLKRKQKKTVQKIIADQMSTLTDYRNIIKSFQRRHAGQYAPSVELFRRLCTIVKACNGADQALISRTVHIGHALGLSESDIHNIVN